MADDAAPIVPVRAGLTALGMSVTMICGAGAQIVLQTHIDADDPPDRQDRQADALMRIARRQRALAEIDELKDELRKQQNTFAEREADERAMQARRAEVLKAKEQAVADQRKVYEIEWGQRRQGAFKSTKQQDEAIRQLLGEVVKVENEHSAAAEGFAKNTAIWKREIEAAAKKVAEAEALIAGG